MCNQQNTTANKLRYLETWLADAELWHESRWNQVRWNEAIATRNLLCFHVKLFKGSFNKERKKDFWLQFIISSKAERVSNDPSLNSFPSFSWTKIYSRGKIFLSFPESARIFCSPFNKLRWKYFLNIKIKLYFISFYIRSVKTNLNSGGAVSRLYIANANRHDSGNYTCSLGDSAKTTIAVHVLNGQWSEREKFTSWTWNNEMRN